MRTTIISPAFPLYLAAIQAKNLDELMKRVKEAIELYLEVEKEAVDVETEFVGVQVVEA